MKTINKKEIHGEAMTSYRACEIAEGFGSGENANPEEILQAWCYLIKTGLCWQLQGWYGRTAHDYIQNGIIDRQGNLIAN